MDNIDNEINNIMANTSPISGTNSDDYREFVMVEKAKKAFASIINFLVDGRDDLNERDKNKLKELLREPSMLSIKSYKCYLRYKAELAWEDHHNANLDSYQNLSYKIMDYLKYYTAEEAIRLFDKEIKEISSITGKDVEWITNIISDYKSAQLSRDVIKISEASSNLKYLVKEYNGKAKESFIKERIDTNIETIKGYFNCVERENSINENQVEIVLEMLIANTKIRNIIRELAYESFDVLLENDELEVLICNVIYHSDEDNYKKLRISHGGEKELLDRTRSFNRLRDNYLNKIIDKFDVSEIDLINQYVKEDDPDKLKELRSKVSNGKVRLLHEIKPIFREADAYLDEEFNLKPNSKILSRLEQKDLKRTYRNMRYYDVLHNTIYKYFIMSAKYLDNIEKGTKKKKVLFTDDNYDLVNLGYLTNLDKLTEFINSIDSNVIHGMDVESSSFIKLKRLLIDDGLIACFLCGPDDIRIVSDIVNNYKLIFKGSLLEDNSINRLSSIIKKAELGKCLDNFTLALLGEEVAEKLVYNVQFLQGKNTPEAMALRLKKADDLMVRAESINKSAVPYFEPIEYEGITLSRYHNNDSRILTSGIDSNTCFKICANDNDYLFYSLLNKNGMVVYFSENGKMCGRFTAHTRNNCLLINSVRSIECDYGIDSLEQKQRDDKIIELVKMFGNKMIELTKDSNCPIDFVIANKSGILESSRYDGDFELADINLFSQFVDTYNDDFEEFRKMYDGKEQLLQEVPLYKPGCKQPFTTDFGHYPIVMITKREGKELNRMWDISRDTPDAIYERGTKPIICGKNTKLSLEELNRVRKIHALEYYYSGGVPKDYVIPTYFNFKFEYFEIKDFEYTLVTTEHIFTSKYTPVNKGGYQYHK
jgi:hypothetical protein